MERRAGDPAIDSLLVRDIMTREVVTARPDMTTHAAARLMADHDVSGLPVVDEPGRLVGVVSDGDVIVYPRPRRARRPWWRRLLRDDDDTGLLQYLRGARGIRVREVMTSPALAVRADLAVALAALIVSRRRIRRLPVVDGEGRLIGVVTRSDLVRAMARGAWSTAPDLRELLVRGTPSRSPATGGPPPRTRSEVARERRPPD
jgi:CBS domain-containing protein